MGKRLLPFGKERKRGRVGGIGRDDLEMEVRQFGAEGGKGVADDGGIVAVATEVDETEVLPTGVGNGIEGLERLAVAEVSVAAADPLLERPWAAGILFEHGLVMIGLDNNGLAVGDEGPEGIGDISEIENPGEFVAGGKEGISPPGEGVGNRVDGIVGNSEGGDFEGAEAKG